jgi:oligopeptide/dipeptide ABC transporter ATP-binding protein
MERTGRTPATPLLEVEDLVKRYAVRQGLFKSGGAQLAAVDRVSMALGRGQVFGLVGESGSGKSTLARCIVRLAGADSGRVRFNGVDMHGMGHRELLDARRRIQLIFQDPAAALSPRRTIRQTLTEPLDHFSIGRPEQRPGLVARALETVGLDAAALPRRPHQFSSGQRQRIGIARALLCEPELVIADEAVSALDVSVQAQILELILRLRAERGIAFLVISHDLAVIRQVADVIGVMYRGQLVETAACQALFDHPMHPYTRQLLAAVPDPDPSVRRDHPAGAAGLARLPAGAGCVFAHRCEQATDRCATAEPADVAHGNAAGHRVKCHLYDDPREDS